MKKIVIVALLIVFILFIAAIAIGIGSKKVDCSGIEDQKQRNRCHLYNLLSSYGLAKDYEQFMNTKPYEKPQPKYFTNSFRDEAIDEDKDGKFNVLKIYVGVKVDVSGEYEIESWLHDDNNKPFYKFDKTMPMQSGFNEAVIDVPSQMIYEHKLLGSLKVPYVRLFKDGKQLETITPEYYTKPYSYDDFGALLPDLVIEKAEIKDGKINVMIANQGKKHAFAIFVDLKVGNDFVYGKQNPNQVTLMKIGDRHEFSIDLPSAKEFVIVVDPSNKVDESNETNNEMLIVK